MTTNRTTSLQAVKTTDVAQRTQDPVVAALSGALSKMKSVLPAHITPEKMSRLAMGELRTNKQLASIAQRNPQSLVSALMKASQAGLEIGGTKGHGYLVPYGSEITFLPGYRGLIQLARQSGQVTSISVHIVYANDVFDMVLGIDEKITHTPKLDGDRGDPKLVYGVARFVDGSHHFDWMSMDDVEHIAAGTQSKGKSGPWRDHRAEMIRKTMVRRLTKYLPMSSDRLEAAVAASDAFDSGQTIDVDGVFVSDDAPSRDGATAGQIETGGQPAADTPITVGDSQATNDGAPSFTFAQVQEALNRATTLDELDEAASLIAACAGGKKQQTDLTEAYQARRVALGGDA